MVENQLQLSNLSMNFSNLQSSSKVIKIALNLPCDNDLYSVLSNLFTYNNL